MIRSSTALLAFIVLVVSAGAGADAGARGLLWRVVQTCLASHYVTGGAFPCLAVETADGADVGYAVLRAPLDGRHVILTPTVRTIGIEADRLRAVDAPDYFRDAWSIRHFVTDGLAHQPTREDLAMAVNSRIGRSQDQLHIHVDCIRPAVKQALQRQAPSLNPDSWTQVTVLPRAPRYWAMPVRSEDLAGVNVFNLVAKGLDVDPRRMDDMTVVVAGSDHLAGSDHARDRPGFIVLARQRVANSQDEAHGEALLNHSCGAFR